MIVLRLQKSKWYDFVMRERMSTSASTGLVELWMNTGSGWQKQTLGSSQTLSLATLGTVNSGGANYHKLALYHMRGMFPMVTLFMGEHKVGTTFEIVAPKSY